MGNLQSLSNAIIFPAPVSTYDETLKDLIWIDEHIPPVGPPAHPTISSESVNFFPALFLQAHYPNDLTILYWHGNSCDLGDVCEELEELRDYINCNICAIEYPGYGLRNDVMPAKETIDTWSLAALRFLVWKGIPTESILCFGRSIGTGPACQLASTLTSQNTVIGGLLLHSPYRSIQSLVKDYAGVPGTWFISEHWDNETRILELGTDCPVLIIHGQDDEIIPVDHGKRLYATCGSKKKKSSFPENSPHNAYLIIKDIGEPISAFLKDFNIKGNARAVQISKAFQRPPEIISNQLAIETPISSPGEGENIKNKLADSKELNETSKSPTNSLLILNKQFSSATILDIGKSAKEIAKGSNSKHIRFFK